MLESYCQTEELSHTQQEASAIQAELETLQKTVEEIKAANLDLRHRLLTSRDHAIGAEAEAARSRQQYEEALVERDQARAEAARLQHQYERTVAERDQASAEAARLQHQYERTVAERDQARAEAAQLNDYAHEMRASTTWRIGSAVVGPISRFLGRRG